MKPVMVEGTFGCEMWPNFACNRGERTLTDGVEIQGVEKVWR